MIKIYNTQGNEKHTTEINNGSKCFFTLMQHDYITLKFSTADAIRFNIGDYVDINDTDINGKAIHFKRFCLVDSYTPTENKTTGGYDYEIRFDAYYWQWKNKIVKFINDSTETNETSWDLTATIDIHLSVLIKNLAKHNFTYYANGESFEFAIDDTIKEQTKAKHIAYANTNIIDALNAIAEVWECEWWVDGNIIHLGTCEFGDTYVPLCNREREDEQGNIVAPNIVEISNVNNRATFATRLYAYGSTRNIPTNYREIEQGTTINGVVQRRLLLPTDTPYVDAYRYTEDFSQRVYLGESGYEDAPNEMPEAEAIEQVVTFEDIYPRREDEIAQVTYDVITDEIENEDGTTTIENWNRYRIKLKSFTEDGIFFHKDYILPNGESLKLSFEGGSLNGMDFEVTFNPDNINESVADSQWFEIVRNEDYGRNLPDAILLPSVGDKVVLYNWDVSLMLDDSLNYISQAEQELKAKTIEYAKESMVDANNYQCKMFSSVMGGYDVNTHTADTSKALVLDIGQRVELFNDLFENGSRKSRIIGYEKNLDYQWDSPTFIVGEKAPISRLSAMESTIKQLTKGGENITSTNGKGVYLIGTNDKTKPSNTNAYSALRSKHQFIDKQNDDLVKGVLSFVQHLQSDTFNSGSLGFGWYLGKDANRASYLEVDKAYIRKKAIFEQLQVKHVGHVGGEQTLSPSGGKITSVEPYVSGITNTINFDGLVSGLITLKQMSSASNPTAVVYSTYHGIFVAVQGGEYYPSWNDVWSYMSDEYLPSSPQKGFVRTDTEFVDTTTNKAYIYRTNNLIEKGNTQISDSYKCYLKTTDGDDTIVNEFAVGDLVMCKIFNLAESKQRYYWRECIEVGTDYIALSVANCDASVENDIPQANDEIVTIGHTFDTDRQNAIILSSVALSSPSITLYQGINTFELSEDKMPVRISPTLGNRFTGDFIIETKEGKFPIAEFTEDKINLGINSKIYSTECSALTEVANLTEDEYLTIDLTEDCRTWKKGDEIEVSINVRSINYGQIDVTLEMEEATANVLGGHTWQLYDPSGKNYDTTLSVTLTCAEDMASHFDTFGYAYLLLMQIGSQDLEVTNVSVRNKSLSTTLERTGINIEQGTIELDADTTTINSNGKQVAMFTTDNKGNTVISADNIDVDNLSVKQLETTSADGNTMSVKEDEIVFKYNDDITIRIHGGELSQVGATDNISFPYKSTSSNTTSFEPLNIFGSDYISIEDDILRCFVFDDIKVALSATLRKATEKEFDGGKISLRMVRYFIPFDTIEADRTTDNAIATEVVWQYQSKWLKYTTTPTFTDNDIVVSFANQSTLKKGHYIYRLESSTSVQNLQSHNITMFTNSNLSAIGKGSVKLFEIARNGVRFSIDTDKYFFIDSDKIEMAFGQNYWRMSANGIESSN